ncbi:amidohydrolase family protein [Sphingobium nicotianae]|uniref:Amidohydrolase family protein n=1 Tax=Sphingobium nicotianae TaxID=2782607 RepID=A0A9X1DBP2_9SPHN|nr:amidohydrolase family protein [Sphingobium nicotianae]MBT2187046.1 amidohydrolase family protein [Sphingobium nicotianae]
MPIARRTFIAMAGAAALTSHGWAAAPRYDLVIKGGRVIDPARGIDAMLDVAIAGGKIAAMGKTIDPGAAQILDATGKLVTPGLIDIHTHASVDPASAGLMLAEGVTGWIEAGWEGAETVDQGIAAVRAAPQKAAFLLNIGRKGVMTTAGETMDLSLADAAAARAAIAAHRDVIVGVKARLSRSIAGDHDLDVLRRAQQAASAFGLPVMIHIGGTFSPLGQLLDLLKPGDIVTHMYAPPPHAIIGDDGRVIPEAIAARKRCVRFDWGHGTHGHVLWEVAEQAARQGFLPDTVSTDWTIAGDRTGVVNMPTIMSNVLALGVPLDQVVAMATINAARSFTFFKGRGTLAPGAPADVAVLELRQGQFELVDTAGKKRPATCKFFPAATILDGKIAARAA